MSIKTAVVGDLHGRYEFAEKILANYDNVVFVGDYVDSFDRSLVYQVRTLEVVLEAHKSGHAIALVGNHEMSYIGSPSDVCSGWSVGASVLFREFYQDLRDLPYYTWVDGILISHAGVSDNLLVGGRYGSEGRVMTLDYYLKRGKFTSVGIARGGSAHCGGLLWCDWFKEFYSLADTRQIMGHSGHRPAGVPRGVLGRGGDYNIDCLDHCEEYVVIEDGVVTVKDFGDL